MEPRTHSHTEKASTPMASKQKKSKKDGKKSRAAKAGKASGKSSGKVGKMVFYFGETKC